MYYKAVKQGVGVPAKTQKQIATVKMNLIGMNVGDIDGYVKDQLGNKLTNALVTISNSTGFIDLQLTDSDGYYTTGERDDFGIPAGNYQMTVTHQAIDSANPGQNRANVTVYKGQTTPQNFKVNVKLSPPRP